MRHALGLLGVLSAGVLLAVSAAMNWRFGYSLGMTETDKQIYGAASAAADCFKALVPFFFFAALRNKMWSQAAASAVLWVVVTGYSLTSALGHAALNRMDTSGQRAVDAAQYSALRADLKRLTEQASWVPSHRPLEAVQAEVDSHKLNRQWGWTESCTKTTGPQSRDYCQKYQALLSEQAFQIFTRSKSSDAHARVRHGRWDWTKQNTNVPAILCRGLGERHSKPARRSVSQKSNRIDGLMRRTGRDQQPAS